MPVVTKSHFTSISPPKIGDTGRWIRGAAREAREQRPLWEPVLRQGGLTPVTGASVEVQCGQRRELETPGAPRPEGGPRQYCHISLWELAQVPTVHTQENALGFLGRRNHFEIL